MKLSIINGRDEVIAESVMQIRHVRRSKVLRDGIPGIPYKEINPYGGLTVVSIVRPDPEVSKLPRIYVARCNDCDHYNKRVGISYCLEEYLRDIFKVNCRWIIQSKDREIKVWLYDEN